MPINERELLSIVSELCQERKLMTTVSGSLKGAAITGGASFVGGLLMGPIGLAVGGIIGGLSGAWKTNGHFRPLHLVIMEDLSAAQRLALAGRLERVLRQLEITDLLLLLPYLLNDEKAMALVLRTIGTFLESEMQLRIVK